MLHVVLWSLVDFKILFSGNLASCADCNRISLACRHTRWFIFRFFAATFEAVNVRWSMALLDIYLRVSLSSKSSATAMASGNVNVTDSFLISVRNPYWTKRWHVQYAVDISSAEFTNVKTVHGHFEGNSRVMCTVTWRIFRCAGRHLKFLQHVDVTRHRQWHHRTAQFKDKDQLLQFVLVSNMIS